MATHGRRGTASEPKPRCTGTSGPEIEPFWAITRYHDIQWVSANDKLFVNGGGRLRLASIEEDKGMRERWAKRVGELGLGPSTSPWTWSSWTGPATPSSAASPPGGSRLAPSGTTSADLDRYAARFAAELEQKLERDGEADLVMDFAIKLPLATICDLLGLPADDWSKVFDFTEIVSDEELAEAPSGRERRRAADAEERASSRQYLAAAHRGLPGCSPR